MPRTFGTLTMAEVISDAIARGTADTAVSLPGIIVSYNAATHRAVVRPAISRLVAAEDEPDEDVAETLPAIHDVPVVWYRARGVSIVPILGLLPGDPVTLLCMDRDISSWLQSGALSEPDDARSHTWANAIALPGLVPSTNPFPAPIDAAALATKVMANLAELALQLNLLQVAFVTHAHAAVGAPGAPPTPTNAAALSTPAYVPGALPSPAPSPVVPVAVASAILKLDL